MRYLRTLVMASLMIAAVGLCSAPGWGQRPREVEQALTQLQDADPTVRVGAIETLARYRYRDTIPVLIATLKDKDARVRTAAAASFKVMSDWSVVDPLVAVLDDPVAAVRLNAIAVLAGYAGREQRLCDPLILRLQDPDAEVRVAAATSLKEGRKNVVAPLLAALQDKEARVRLAAMKSLVGRDDGQMVEPLVAALRDPDLGVALLAMRALEKWRDSRMVEPVAALLACSDPATARAAAERLGRLNDTRAVGPLVAALASSDVELRVCAVTALGLIAHPTSPPRKAEVTADPAEAATGTKVVRDGAELGRGEAAVARALRDPAAKVRLEAARCLGEGNANPDVVEPLAVSLADGDAAVRRQAAASLAWHQDGRGFAVLVETLQIGDPEAVTVAIRALGQLPDPRVVDPLLATLQGSNAVTAQAAAVVLGQRREKRAVEPLIAALRDKSHELRRAAARALGSLKDEAAVPALIALLDDGDQQTAMYASISLVAITEKRGLNRNRAAWEQYWYAEHLQVPVPVAAAVEPDPRPAQALAAAQAFLTDPELPAMPAPLRTGNAPSEWKRPEFLYYETRRSSIEPSGHVVLDQSAMRVVAYRAPAPVGPVPMREMPRAEAEPIALAFAQRHLPQLFAPGGEVESIPPRSTDPPVSTDGACVFAWQRMEGGVRVPTRVEVRVRVYDGRVVGYRGEHTPVTIDLESTVSLDQAKQAATADVQGTRRVGTWMECRRELVSLEGAQRVLWTLWAKEEGPWPDGGYRTTSYRRWQIDAHTGEVILREAKAPLSIDVRRWMENVQYGPAPSSARRISVTDDDPVFSPDGLRIAFVSNRARPGYPSWRGYGGGLFVANVNGSEMRCLRATGARSPRWATDGKRLAYYGHHGQGAHGAITSVHVLNLDDGSETECVPPVGRRFSGFTWLSTGEIATIVDGSQNVILIFDPAHLEAAPREIRPALEKGDKLAAVHSDPQGRLVFATGWERTPGDDRSMQDAWRKSTTGQVWRLDPVAAETRPQVIATVPLSQSGRPSAPALAFAPGGRLAFVRAGNSMTGGSSMTLVNAETGATEEWKLPRLTMPERAHPAFVPNPTALAWSPNGNEVAFVADYRTDDREETEAQVIYLCRHDGSELRLVTHVDSAVVPAYVFPETGKPAFAATE